MISTYLVPSISRSCARTVPVSPGPWHDAQRCVELLNIDDVTFYALIFAGAKALRSKFSYFINLLFNQIHFLGMKIEMNEL